MKMKKGMDFRKICKMIKTILVISMIILIFLVSPRITNAIQNGAKWIYELDSTSITRVVELVLAVTLIGTISLQKKGE